MNSKIIRDCFNKKDLYNIFLLEEELDCIDSLNKDVFYFYVLIKGMYYNQSYFSMTLVEK